MKLSKVLFASVVAVGLARAPRAEACGGGEPEKPVLFVHTDFSHRAMGDAIAALKTCETESLCGPFSVIKSWGAKAVPSLLNNLQSSSGRYAMHLRNLLEAAKVPGSGVKVFAIASAMQDVYAAGEAYEVAVKIDGKLVFNTFARALERETDAARAASLMQGMRLLPDDSLAFVTREMPHTKNPVALAGLAERIATKDNAKNIAGLVPHTKSLIARHRLAAAAIRAEFVKDELFDTFHASLTSKDADARKDALDYLWVEMVPAHLQPQFLEVLQKQVANNEIPLATSSARKLFDFGARDRATFDVLFTGLDSPKQHEVFRALANMKKLGAQVPDDLRPIYIEQVEKLLAITTNSSAKNLGGKALTALRASSSGS